MTLQSYEIVEWENLTENSRNFENQDNFDSTGALFDRRLEQKQIFPLVESREPSASILPADELNYKLRTTYNELRSGAYWPNAVLFTFENFLFLGEEGIIVDTLGKKILCGGAFGSSITFVKDYLRNLIGAVDGDDYRPVLLDIDKIDIEKIDEPGLVLTSPGQTVFGHWLLDFVPRLFIAEQLGLNRGTVYLSQRHSWADIFFDVFNIPLTSIRTYSTTRCQFYRSVNYISVLKSGYLLDRTIVRQAWNVLSARLASIPSKLEEPFGEKVFVTRQGWNSRSLENEQELVELAVERGYKTVYPEQYALADQARIFQSARFIVGPDGSGLHNIIFSYPEAKLGVILFPNRGDLWHATVCDAMGHYVVHTMASERPDGAFVLEPETFLNLINVMESNI